MVPNGTGICLIVLNRTFAMCVESIFFSFHYPNRETKFLLSDVNALESASNFFFKQITAKVVGCSRNNCSTVCACECVNVMVTNDAAVNGSSACIANNCGRILRESKRKLKFTQIQVS